MTTQIYGEKRKDDKANLWSALKEHPIVIVLGFCAATAGAMAAIYEKVVIPYQVKVLEVQVADLKQQLALLPVTEKTVAEKEAAIAKLREEVVALRQRTVELSKENVFSTDDPYPKAFRRVRLGDLFSKVEQTYPGQVTKDDPDDTYASIKVEDFFFRIVTFYYDETVKPHRVTLILFHVKEDVPLKDLLKARGAASLNQSLEENVRANVGTLKAQLTERYGAGAVGKRETVWKVKGLIITLQDKGLFSIDKR